MKTQRRNVKKRHHSRKIIGGDVNPPVTYLTVEAARNIVNARNQANQLCSTKKPGFFGMGCGKGCKSENGLCVQSSLPTDNKVYLVKMRYYLQYEMTNDEKFMYENELPTEKLENMVKNNESVIYDNLSSKVNQSDYRYYYNTPEYKQITQQEKEQQEEIWRKQRENKRQEWGNSPEGQAEQQRIAFEQSPEGQLRRQQEQEQQYRTKVEQEAQRRVNMTNKSKFEQDVRMRMKDILNASP